MCETLSLWGKSLLVAALSALVLLPALNGCSDRDARSGRFVVGAVNLTPVDTSTLQGFQQRMAELGYIEGKNIEYRHTGPAGSIERLDEIIPPLVEKGVDLIFVSSTPATLAVQRYTRDKPIPVVFAPVNDPVAAGIVRGLKAPGGNITGIRLPLGDDLRLQWLKRIAPQVKRVWVPYNAPDKSAQASLAQVREAAPRLGLEVQAQVVGGTEQIRTALADLPEEVDAIFLPRDSTVEAHIADFVALARARGLPVCAPSLIQVEAGALFSYGFVHRDIGRQAARLADQILRGMRPADLPVEMAENHLAINLRTARHIGLEVPDAILNQAERIIRE